MKGVEDKRHPSGHAMWKKPEQCGNLPRCAATMTEPPTRGFPMAGLKGTRFEDFILAAKKRAEDAIEQHNPRLTTLEKSLRDAAIRRRNNDRHDDGRQHH